MNDLAVMGIVDGDDQLGKELGHDGIRDPAVLKPGSKRRQRLAHELKNETNMCAIGSSVLEIIKKVNRCACIRQDSGLRLADA